MKIGPLAYKEQKSSKLSFKAAQQIYSDVCLEFQIIFSTVEQRKAIRNDIIQCFLLLFFFFKWEELYLFIGF